MNTKLVSLLICGLFVPAVLYADDVDQFSRANCFNNESITYDYFAPPWYGAVVGHHYDQWNGNHIHYVGHDDPIACYGNFNPPPGLCPSSPGWYEDAKCELWQQCFFPLGYSNAFKAIHNVSDNVGTPEIPVTRWRTVGLHNHYYGEFFGVPVQIVDQTEATDCNLHFNQFY